MCIATVDNLRNKLQHKVIQFFPQNQINVKKQTKKYF